MPLRLKVQFNGPKTKELSLDEHQSLPEPRYITYVFDLLKDLDISPPSRNSDVVPTPKSGYVTCTYRLTEIGMDVRRILSHVDSIANFQQVDCRCY